MKTYEAFDSSPEGWNINSTLELEDNGRFSYSEGWTDYTNASLSAGAGGTWRREGSVLVFKAESVYGRLAFQWGVGMEWSAAEQGDTLVFGNGWKLSEPGEHVIQVPVANKGERPLTVRFEPWGISHILEPGERLLIVGRGPYSWVKHKIDRGADEVVYHGWPGSRVNVEYESKPPAAPQPPPVQPPAAADAAHAPRPPRYAPPPVNPFPLSPRLAASLRGLIDELPTEGPGNWVVRLCREHDALPLHGTQFRVWALRTDGQLLVIDHESAAQSVEPETHDALAYAALAQGASKHPELAELLTNIPGRAFKCLRCDGRGQVEATPPAQGTSQCLWCSGMGWCAPTS